MKYLICLILLMVLPTTAPGAEKAADPKPPYYPRDYRDVETDPEVGEGIQKYAEDAQQGPQKNFGVQPVHDNQMFATFKADRFEHQWREHGMEALLWDVQGWIGRDYNKLVLESEGHYRLDGDEEVEEAMVELFYSRNVARFWDFRIGVRHDFEPQPERSFLAAGFEGLAPQWFEVDATAYLSEDGDVSAKVEVEYELMFTQRLVLIPRLEAGLALQDVPEYGQWEGVTDMSLGARLMYHIRREFAPYLGVTWSRQLGETANRVEDAGGDISASAVVAGIRFWF